MREFCALYEQLDRSPAPTARVEKRCGLISRQWIPERRGLGAQPVASANGRKRLLTGRRLRWKFGPGRLQLCPNGCRRLATASGRQCRKPSPCCCPSCAARSRADRAPLQIVLGSGCRRSPALEVHAQAEAVRQHLGEVCRRASAFLFNKLLTGGLRVGVSTGDWMTRPWRGWRASKKRQRSPSGHGCLGGPQRRRLPRPASPR